MYLNQKEAKVSQAKQNISMLSMALLAQSLALAELKFGFPCNTPPPIVGTAVARGALLKALSEEEEEEEEEAPSLYIARHLCVPSRLELLARHTYI